MKKLLFSLCIIGLLFSHAQTEDVIPDNKSQLKITSSIEYQKMPFKMRMFKKFMPKENIAYYSNTGTRKEINMDIKMLGEHVIMSNTYVSNYKLSKKWSKELMIENDSIVKNEFKAKDIQGLGGDSNILIGKDAKEILGYPCVSFSAENDTSKIEGFLAPGIMGHGKFNNHGMPLELKVTAKIEKMVSITMVNSIEIEPLNQDLFRLEKD